MKRSTYRIQEDQKKLVYVESYDKLNRIAESIDYTAIPNQKRTFEYDENDMVIKEFEYYNNIIARRLEFSYNEKKELILSKVYLENDTNVFEQTIIKRIERDHIEIIEQEQKEISRKEKKYNGKNYIIKYFDDEELSEVQNYIYSEEKKEGLMEIYNEHQSLIAVRVYRYNEQEKLIEFKETDDQGNLFTQDTYEYHNNQLIRTISKNYSGNTEELVFRNTYDENNNLIKKEKRTLLGDILEFTNYYYEANLLIRETGYVRDQHEAIYGAGVFGENFEFVHEYKSN